MRKLIPILVLICGWAIPAEATITRAVASAVNFNASSNTVTATISCAAGNLATVFAATRNGGATLTITDSTIVSNTWTGYPGFVNIQFGNHSETELISYSVVAVSFTSVTVTSTQGSAGMYLSVSCYHSTNGWPANPRDASAGPTIGTGVMSFSAGPTGTLSQASEVIYGCALFVFDPGAITPGNSFVTQTNSTYDSSNSALEYTADKIVSATTAQTFAVTTANSVDSAPAVVTFKDNASAGGVTRLRGSVISR